MRSHHGRTDVALQRSQLTHAVPVAIDREERLLQQVLCQRTVTGQEIGSAQQCRRANRDQLDERGVRVHGLPSRTSGTPPSTHKTSEGAPQGYTSDEPRLYPGWCSTAAGSSTGAVRVISPPSWLP